MLTTPITGIFVFDPSIDFSRFFADCKDWGVTLPFLNPYLLQTPLLKSLLLRKTPEFCLNFPVYYDESYLAEHPQDYARTRDGGRGQHLWLHVACPTTPGFLERKVKELQTLLREFRPQAVSFDFIRFFVFWEGVRPDADPLAINDGCYCPRCLRQFSKDCGIALPVSQPEQTLKQAHLREWGAWKCAVISKALRTLVEAAHEVSPGLPTMAKMVPWRQHDFQDAAAHVAGQDAAQFKEMVEYIVPMTFSHLLYRDAAWKASVLNEFRQRTGQAMLSYVQVEKLYRDEEIAPADFFEDVRTSRRETPEGMILFNYEQLQGHPERIRLLCEARTQTI